MSYKTDWAIKTSRLFLHTFVALLLQQSRSELTAQALTSEPVGRLYADTLH
jgi:hypothetical protein